VTRETELPARRATLLAFAPVLAVAIGIAAAPSAGGSDSERLPVAAAACRHQGDAETTLAVQEGAMRCLVNRARRARGLPGFVAFAGLDRAAERKSADILRCDEFSHEACGRDFTYWVERFGHLGKDCTGVAENIAWGTGDLATPIAIFRAWMRSPGHRANILGRYVALGIGVRVGSLDGREGVHVWTQTFAGEGC
jgi:uncharacterized protein YkwD